MAEIKSRLKETSEACLKAYEAWGKEKKDKNLQEELHEAIHELRKVASRLEIELAVSERDQLANKPLPIPSHKSTHKGDSTSILDNGGDDNNNKSSGQKAAPRRRRTQRKQG